MDNNNTLFNSLGTDNASTVAAPASATPASQDDADLKALENMSDEEFLEAFAAGLLVEKNLGDMDDETRADMVHDLVERITTFVNRAILEALPEEKLDEINQLSDNNASLEEINKVVQGTGIDVNQITASALEKFRTIYLGANENAEV